MRLIPSWEYECLYTRPRLDDALARIVHWYLEKVIFVVVGFGRVLNVATYMRINKLEPKYRKPTVTQGIVFV